MELNINFYTEDIEEIELSENKLSLWINKVIQINERNTGNLSFIFCSDAYLLRINQDYLNHDYYTDIITFDNSEEGKLIEGDLFISVDRVRENAEKLDVSFFVELHRVMIHGVLHLLGFNDKTKAEEKLMRSTEETCLEILEQLNS